MLLRVILKNFLSFDNAEQFDMFPNNKRTSLSEHVMSVGGNIPVLKMAAIYGANGAGKSNLLKSLSFIKAFVNQKDFMDADRISDFFFALKEDAGREPIGLTFEFTTPDDNAYIYSVEIAQEGIVSEELYVSGLGNTSNSLVFKRTFNEIEYSGKLSSEITGIIRGWIDKNPYSSLFTINNDMPVLTDSHISRAQNWFDHGLVVIGLNSRNINLISILKENHLVNAFANKLLHDIDLGINGVRVQTENFEDWITSHKLPAISPDEIGMIRQGYELSQLVDSRNTQSITVEKGIQKISQLIFEQFGRDGYLKDMTITQQSDGTVRLLSLAPAFYDAIRLGKTVIVDELDHSIHPSLVIGLIKFFTNNNAAGQLIFTTHQTCLMNQDLMRADEMWLAEKKDGATHIYSINDFKIHHSIKIENGYLEGRYGAIPYIGESAI